MKGIFYTVGVGPGDPELMTIKAVNTIKKADVIIVPKSHSVNESVAHNIAKEYMTDKANLLQLVFPMQGKQKDWADAWQENADIIKKHLDEGEKVVFLTLGDPMFYSTSIYVFRLLKDAGYNVESVPGITAFCAIASRAEFPLVEGDDPLTVLPATASDDIIEKAMDIGSNLVVMKVSHNLEIFDKLEQKGYNNKIMVSKVGQKDEEIVEDFSPYKNEKPHYLSTILARKK